MSPPLSKDTFFSALVGMAEATVTVVGELCQVSVHDLSSNPPVLVHRAGENIGTNTPNLPEPISAALRFYGSQLPARFSFVSHTEGRVHKNSVSFTHSGHGELLACVCVTQDITAYLKHLELLRGVVCTNGFVSPLPVTSLDSSPDPHEHSCPLASCSEHAALLTAQLRPRAQHPIRTAIPRSRHSTWNYPPPSNAADFFPLPDEHSSQESDTPLMAHVSELIRQIGVPVPLMTNHDRLRLVELLESRNVFLLKGAVEQVATVLNVSRYTVYYYLKKLRKPDAPLSS